MATATKKNEKKQKMTSAAIAWRRLKKDKMEIGRAHV